MKRITVLFCFLLSVFLTYGQEVVVGTGTTLERYPIGALWGYERSAALYTAAEIGQVGFINQVAWEIGAVGQARPVRIFLKEIEESTLVANDWASFIADATLMFDGVVHPAATGFYPITFLSSFNFTGGNKNLLVLVETNYGGSGGGTTFNIKSTAATNMHFTVTKDTSPPTTNLSAVANRPNIRLTFGPEITCPPISAIITNTTATAISFNVTNRNSTTEVSYEIRTEGAVGSGATGLVDSGTITDLTTLPVTVSELIPSTTYSLYVRANCGTTETSAFSDATVFTTTQVAATMPYSEDFEGTVNFSYTNHTVNKWHVGTAVNNGGTHALYISNNEGVANAYTLAVTDGQVSQAYRDIAVPAGTTDININFDWRCMGESIGSSKYDYFRVWAVPTNYTPVAGTQITAAADRIRVGSTEYNNNDAFLRENIVFDASTFAGQAMRLVFEWRQDFSSGNQPPAAIDNLNVSVITCPQPAGLTLGLIGGDRVEVNWTAVPNVTSYDVYIGTTADEPAANATLLSVTGTSHIFEGLNPLTQYYIWVRSHCSDTDQSLWTRIDVRTGLMPVSIPYSENFEGDVVFGYIGNGINKWAIGTAVNNGGTHALYISKDNGVSYEYNVAGTQVAHAFKDFTIPAGTTDLVMNFDWRCVGETSEVDYFRVWVVPVDFTPTAGTQVATGTNRTRVGRSAYNGNNVFLNENIIVNATAFAGQTMRVIFEWRQDSSGGTQPPAAIDNLNIRPYTCRNVDNATIQINNITTTSATVAWTATNATSYDVYYSDSPVNPTNTTVPTANTTGTTQVIDNLLPGNQYFVWVRSNCGVDDLGVWIGPKIIATDMTPTALPYTEDFEGVTNFEFKKNDAKNKWFVGTAVNNGGQKALYISENLGLAHTYNTSGTQVSHVYKDFTIPAGSENISVNFDWMSYGEGFTATLFYDYFRVWAVPASFTPVVGTQITAAADRIQLGRPQYNNKTTFEREFLEAAINGFAGQTMRLVFEWKQDTSGGNQPPAAIDNLEVRVLTCARPTNFEYTNRTNDEITLSWTGITGQDTYEIFYATTNTPPGETVTGSVLATTNPYTLSGLTANTTYYLWIRTVCSETDHSVWVPLNASGVTTGQVPGILPYEDGFEGENNWTIISNTLNKWIVGTAVHNGGTKSLYVTKDDGATNTYSNTTATVTHAYRDIAIPATASEVRLSFDWRAKGESCCDYIRVWIVPVTFDPVLGTQIAAGTNRMQIGGNRNVQENFTNVIENVEVRNYAGRSLRLVFEWRNDGSGGDNPAGAIDNVKVEEVSCPRVTGLGACAGVEYINYGWDQQDGISQWDIAFETTDVLEPNPANVQRVDEPNYTAEGLTVATNYYFFVRNVCSENTNSDWKKIKVRTNSVSILDAEPFCAGPEGIIFPNNNTENGAEEYPYGRDTAIACVSSVRFPIWYFLKVDQDGELIFDIIQNSQFDANGTPTGATMDVDFVAFGPFDNLDQACAEAILGPCAGCTSNSNPNDGRYPIGNVVDCNYSASAVEKLTIRNARRGQIYAVLITNFDRGRGFIKLVQTNGDRNNAGTTDCKFLCEVDLGPDQYLCSDVSSYTIEANISAAGSTEDMVYTWYKDGELMDPTIFNTKKLVVTESGTYRVKVEKDLCEENPEDEVVITFYDPISLRLPKKIELCDLENVGYAMFEVKSVVDEALANHPEAATIKHRYYHTLADFNAKRNAFEMEDQYQSSGNESIFVEVYRDKNEECRGYFEIELKIKATAYFNAEFSYDGPICINNIEELPITPGAEFTPGGIFTYKTISHTNPKDPSKEPKGGLSLDKDTGTINVAASTAGVYEVKYYYGVPSTMCGESVEHTVTITIFERFEIALDGDCYDGNYYMRVLDIAGNIDMDHAKFEWIGPGGFTGDTKEIIVSEKGDYTVYITTKDGCYEEKSITLEPEEINCLITRGISPNGDGKNDYFDLINYKVLKFKVFNRNGSEVYTHGLGYTREWMGQDKSGNKLPSGTYFYVIETVQKTITGWVQINY